MMKPSRLNCSLEYRKNILLRMLIKLVFLLLSAYYLTHAT